MFHAWFNGLNICTHGSAGTGKTFLAMYLAFSSVIDRRDQNRIIIVRSAVPTREIGFLPGTLEEKSALYELPYVDICHELIGRASTYENMKDAGVIEFMTTSFIRGLTWDNAVVVVDEAQNMTFHEIDSIMTRLGHNTRIIVNGDIKQTDLEGKKNGVCGMGQFMNIIKNMKEFTTVQYTVHDIVRSDLVKSWIKASEMTQ
jgi:phosphate starvation-inducible protein PhoH